MIYVIYLQHGLWKSHDSKRMFVEDFAAKTCRIVEFMSMWGIVMWLKIIIKLESMQNFVALFLTFVFPKRANMQTVFVVFVTVKNRLNIPLASSNRAEYLSSRY